MFDLDSTCIYSVLIKPEEYEELKRKYQNKETFLINLTYKGKNLFYSLVIRKGLLDFIHFTKQFCNYYISTLAFDTYGKIIKNILEKKLGCKFINFQAKDNKFGNKKYLDSLGINNNDTLILDDSPSVWDKENANVIFSKKFVDKDFINLNLEKKYKGNISKNDYINYYKEITISFCHYESQKKNYKEIKWKEQKFFHGRFCPFFYYEDNKNNDFYSLENMDSAKSQLVYLKDIIKVIYYFLFNYGINISDAIKLIRYNIFYKESFNLSYYRNPVGDGERILKEIIEICGGKIINNENKSKEKIYYVCRKEDYSKFKDKLQKELLMHENAKVINDKFIIDSFYFMENLESELENSDYSFNNERNDDFYDY